MFKKTSLAIFMLLWGLTASAQASETRTLFVAGTSQIVDGADRVFSFEVRNTEPRRVSVRGTLVVASLYDASAPSTLMIENVEVPAADSSRIAVRWHDAPLFGQARLTLTLYKDAVQSPAVVASYRFWLLPGPANVTWFGGGALVLAVLVLCLLRFKKKRAPARAAAVPKPIVLKKPHVPSNMVAYAIENGDTVMTLSNRFEVSWQDLVRANRLKPPYTLKPGSLLLIPKHSLKPHITPPKL